MRDSQFNSHSVTYNNSEFTSKETIDEVSLYFDDIIRNKDMIKEMFKTNILVYEDKIRLNAEKIKSLKEELVKLNSDFCLVENKMKLEYAKNHDNFQKHEINFKLLDKTHTHYKMLMREREEEIKKIEEQTIFAHQDYQNKKIKLDCINVQIVEAEFQLQNLQKKVNEQINQIIEKQEYEKGKKDSDNLNMSEYSRPRNKSKDSVDIFETMSMNGEGLRKNKCIIY